MNGYPKVFNIELDPREEYNIGAQYEWVIGPTLKVVENTRPASGAIRTLRQPTSRASDHVITVAGTKAPAELEHEVLAGRDLLKLLHGELCDRLASSG